MTEKIIEVIKHAAVKSKDGMIFLGKCHSDCFMQAHNCGVKMSSAALDQGFFTSHGRYLSRTDAAYIAVQTLQVRKPCSILYSEDIWCEQDGGRFQYDSIKGYYEGRDE